MTATVNSVPEDRQITSVGKALELLAAFRGTIPELGVSELARRAGMPKSTAFRLLADLEHAGFVARSGAKYRLGLSLFELGSRVGFCRPNGLRDVAIHDLSSLHVQTGLTAHLAILEGTDVVYVEKVHAANWPRVVTVPGARMPASCTGLGKAILAFSDGATVRAVVESGLPRRTRNSITEPGRFVRELRRVREAGVAYDREEGTLGLSCVAAPILVGGGAVAAISASGPTFGTSWERVESHVRRSAEGISRAYLLRMAEVS
ncbi:IclR family transcriptional regulator [Knoellia sp. CPCC 206435]|uniref:IclR family transcriptional regulator n=1 Tax=Knoellia terrae TaxID=3404797 RepID=UPI003B42C028